MLACASVCSVHTPARIRSLTRSCQRCSEDDTIGDLKKLVAAHAGTALRACGARKTEGCAPLCFHAPSRRHSARKDSHPEVVRVGPGGVHAARRARRTQLTLTRIDRYNVFKDHITLEDYEIHDGMGLELYCACVRAHMRAAWRG